jgi:hypothetical protein|tara:strand:- start:377 stop:814 length:438 start_codon:yes stop_codon:yes gene_type:complete
MPSPRKDEEKKNYISRCMSSEEAKRDFPDSKQRVAFCNSKWENKGKSSAIFLYEDPKTGELFHFKRRGGHRKNGRTLIFVKRVKGETMSDDLNEWADHILNKAAESYTNANKKSGYPPNCNEGYVAKDGKCVPVKEEDAGKLNET